MVSELEAIDDYRRSARDGQEELLAGLLADERRHADVLLEALRARLLAGRRAMNLRREPRPGPLLQDASMKAVEYGVALVAFIAACLLALARG